MRIEMWELMLIVIIAPIAGLIAYNFVSQYLGGILAGIALGIILGRFAEKEAED